MTSHYLDEERIFHTARKLPDAESQGEYLDQVCAGDQALRERVESLLEVHEKEQCFLKSNGDLPPTEAIGDVGVAAGQQIGRYKLLQKIGEGGFGVVFMAEQHRPVRRKVALKVIKPGMDTKAVVARFEAERQALAMMDHPNIAKVLDGGATESGRPYFVMELVKGVPLTEYCDHNQLPTDERLALFVTVCQAVQHAHQKGIIHRDLKPSNILVTLHDGKPVIKVIDFGVAKAINQQLTEKTLFTAFGQMVGTPQYMSPEQAEISGLDVDTRSDVYSLGVLLYELLTGSTPLECEQLREAGYAEIQRLIKESEPPKPSTRLSTSGEKLTVIARHRSASPDRLSALMRGDLDWVVMKALEKDRTRRYEDPRDLADDVRNYLAHEPVNARPPTLGYRASKYLKRHRFPLVVAASFFFSLLLGLAGTSTQMFVAWSKQEELDQALTAATIAQQNLDQERKQAEERAATSQRILSKLWEILADRALDATFRGDYREAQVAIEEARAAKAPPEITDTLTGLAEFFDGKSEQAIKTLETAKTTNPTSLSVLSALCWMYQHQAMYGKHEETQQRLRSAKATLSNELRVYEDLFVCLESYVDGSKDDLYRNLALVNVILERKRRWGAAWIIRSQLHTELGMEEHSLTKCRQAIDDFDEARARLGDNPIVNSIGLFALVTAIELAESQDEPAEAWIARAESLCAQYDSSSVDILGMHLAAVFLRQRGQTQVADRLENELLERTEYGKIMWTSERVGFDRAKIRMAEWREEASNLEMQISLAMAIASSQPTAQERADARSIIEKVISRRPAAAFITLAMDVACVLGDHDLAKKLLTEAQDSESVKMDWRWWKRALEFYSGDLSEDVLLTQAEPFNGSRSVAYYIIGMKALLHRDLNKARMYFQKTIETGTVTFWSYHSAKVWVKKLQLDSDWPD